MFHNEIIDIEHTSRRFFVDQISILFFGNASFAADFHFARKLCLTLINAGCTCVETNFVILELATLLDLSVLSNVT